MNTAFAANPGGCNCIFAAVLWYENPRSYDPFESEFPNMLLIYRTRGRRSVRFRTHVIFFDHKVFDLYVQKNPFQLLWSGENRCLQSVIAMIPA